MEYGKGDKMMPLVYRPVIKSIAVTNDFRKKLIARLWPKEQFSVPQIADQTWIGYFEGLKDAGYYEAELIIDALKTHGQIVFSLEE